MANDPLQQFADALRAAAANGPVTLNALFIQNNGPTPPPGFDAMLKAAFRLPDSAAGLQVAFQPANVGPISAGSFTVTSATLVQDFVGTTNGQTSVKMTFSLPAQVLQVQIEAGMPSAWTFQSFFTWMAGWPFTIINYTQPTFVFSTVKTAYGWNGTTITLEPGQNFTSSFSVPAQFQPIFKLVQGLGVVPSPLPLFGPVALNKANNETVLYPDMDLRAPISNSAIEVYFLKAYAPYIGVRVQTVVDTPEFAEVGDEAETFQTPELYFGAKFDIALDVPADSLDAQKTLTLQLQSTLLQSGRQYGFTINVDPESEVRLTPMTVASALMNGNSYFRYVPPVLQEFLTTIGLEGLSMSGPLLPQPGLSSVGVSLASAAGQPITLIGDPTNGAVFQLTSIAMSWTLLNPLDRAAMKNLVTFTSTFILFPDVFKQPDCKTPGGEFLVSIDQDFNIEAGFTGCVSMDDLLRKLTMGAIGMPDGVSITFSDVLLSLNPSAKTYSFGFTFDATLDFITFGGQPLIQFQGMTFKLTATTPTQPKPGTKGTTAYAGSIQGVIGVGPVMVNTLVSYDGTGATKIWRLQTSLAQPLNLNDLVAQFFKMLGGSYEFPSFLPGTLTVETFSVDATIPVVGTQAPAQVTADGLVLAGGPMKPTYKVAGSVAWEYNGIPGFPIRTKAEIGLAYDGNKPGQEFSGSVIGTVITVFTYGSINVTLELKVGYRFGPAEQDARDLGTTPAQLGAAGPLAASSVLWIEWEGIRSTFDLTKQTVTFSLNGWTVGGLIQSLMRLVGDPYFVLPSPWDLLNRISLDGLKVTYDMKPNVANRVTASYSLPAPIDFGFMKINGLKFQLVEGKVTIAIDGSTVIPGLQDTPLFNPKSGGQDVQDMPPVPGQGTQLFELNLLALGQRVGIVGSPTFDSTQAVIKAMEGVPATSGKTNPVNPTSTENGQPYYNPAVNWLVAADFGLLKVGPVYTFRAMVVFNDPNLYGLRLMFNGEKAKVLAGLVIDILYKKITDDIGLYQLDFSFPSILRNLNFGAVTVILPSFRIQIYTNGDFFFDFGFPYNLDFTRSFTVIAIVYGVPVLGSAGFYFGKLSNATATGLPATTKGTFDPVIVFGLGIQVGVGYYFEKGPLKAGFSITFFGIIEGTIAAWHPYQIANAPTNTTEVQGNYYFKLKGSFGIIGKLYGSVDFAIIKADVELLVQIVAQVMYESFRKIPLSLSAHVSVKVSLKINLGLFSISISFSFAITLTAQLDIGRNEIAPWDSTTGLTLRDRRTRALPPASVRRRMGLMAAQRLRFKPMAMPGANAVAAADVLPKLTLSPAAQFTVLTPDVNSTQLASQQGAFVFLLAMDAPTAGGTGNVAESSFQTMCKALLPWVIDALLNPDADTMAAGALDSTPVTKIQLQEILDALANTATPPISYEDIMKFLETNFTIDVVPNAEALKGGATIFPAFTGFSLVVPDPKGGSGDPVTIELGQYTTITDSYRAAISVIFAELAARVNEEQGGRRAPEASIDAPIAMARFMFEDYFLLVARQLVQASIDALDDYAYRLQPGDSLQSILTWLRQRGNEDVDGNEHMIVQDIATPNLATPLSPKKGLSLQGLSYTIQRGDTLQKIADRFSDPAAENKRWVTTPANVIIANGVFSTMVAVDVKLVLDINGRTDTYTTVPGDSFSSIAAAVGLTLDELAKQKSLYTMPELIVPSVTITIPAIAYTTAAGDTLQSITTAFAMTLDALVDVPANQTVTDMFDTTASPTIPVADLTSLYVSDLWDVIVRTDQIAQTAGMAARYPLHGVRLPNVQGLGLSSAFLYPTGQPDYGLYQLTGQQFPTPEFTATPTYAISLLKDSSLSWVRFDGSAGTTKLPVDLSKQAGELKVVLDYARTVGYNPKPGLEIQPDVSVQPKRTAVRNASLWSTSGQSELAAITAPVELAEVAATEASQGAQPQPVLWGLPESLLREAEVRQAALTAGGFDVKASRQYLPVLQPQVGTTDPAARETTFAPIERFAFSTRVDFQVKRLAQTADTAPQNPFANNVVPPDSGNAGTPARPLAPYNYELIGPGPQDAILLQRMLTAMDTLGEGIVSGLFILYPDNPAAPTGLVGRAAPEFLSFITQTNLSTETNPPQLLLANAMMAGTPPRGIANTPGEFIKLMWELSTVRSGGYYLYYETVGADAGLPDDLFDTSGVATLTLVIAHARAMEPADGGLLTNYTNSFFSTDAIDLNRSVISLESRSLPATTTQLKGNETLGGLSALYGASVGSLAALNSTRALAPTVRVPIGGALRQVTPADITGGNVLAKYAAAFSVGAVTPITAADIQAYNPGVPVALYSVFRIPPVTYAVSAAAGGPGATFASMATYYGLSMDALADLARNVVGIFPATTVLATDSLQYDVLPTLGTGNIGVNLTRADLGNPADLPANPTPEQKRAFAEAYLYSLYQLLTAGIYGNAFFNASRPGLSFGPRKQLAPSEARALRQPAQRRALLAAQANEPFQYGQALGFGVFSTKNPAPVAAEGNVPPQAANPYKGIGTFAQFNLNWVDVFGNRTVTPFTAPQPAYAGPLNNPPSMIDYTDALVGPDKWPNVRMYYTYAGQAGAPQFQLVMALNTGAYEPQAGDKPCVANPGPGDEVPAWQRQALDDLETFRRIYYQLHQNYDTLGIPGLSGNAVSMALRNSILAAGEQALPAADEASVRAFVQACAQYVYNRANCKPGGTPPALTLSSAIAMGSLTDANIIKLEVALTLRRQALLADPALRALTDAITATAAVPPLMDDPAQEGTLPPVTDAGEPAPPPQDLSAFAAAAEKVFVTPDWQMRIGAGAGAPDQPRTESSVSVWAVRMGLKPGKGITYTIGNTPSYYAPMPVATEMRTDTAVLNKYATGKPYPDGQTGPMTFSGVDMNVWANSALAAVDTFLTPTFASPAFIMDNLLFDDPQEDGYVAQILEHKAVLADAISSTVRPILATSATDRNSMQSASEKMRQALLDRLSNAFIVTAVTVVPVSGAQTNQPDEPGVAASPRLFGQPQAVAAGIELATGIAAERNYSLTSGKVPLTPSGGDGDTRLAFLFSSKNVTSQTFVSLDLAYEMTHLEFNIRNVPGITGYEQSSWITFVTGPFTSPIARAANVPVVLRALPTPPTVTAQTATAINVGEDGAPVLASATASPADLAKWNYGFNYVYLGSAQDAVRARMQFNLAPGSLKALAADPTKQLFDALAQFMYSYPQIATDLETALRTVNASSTKGSITVAQYAVQAFADIIGNVASAYKAWANAQIAPALAAAPPSLVETVFDIVLTNDAGVARVDVFRVSLTPPGTVLPAPIILVEPETYQWEVVTTPSPGAWVSYKYAVRTPVSGQDPYLMYDEALSIPDRAVAMEQLNLFGFQNAWSAVRVTRNQFLVPGVPTTDTFRFATPEVGFAEPIVPLLQYDAYNLRTVVPGPARFEEYLNAFFISLLSGAVGQEILGKLGGSFSYRLMPELQDSPRTTLPIALLPPTPSVAVAGAPPAFVKPFAAVVADWLALNAPVLNASSQVNTDVAIFAGLSASASSQLPLLTIRNLYVDANAIQP